MAFLRSGFGPLLLAIAALLFALPAFADAPVGPTGTPRPEDEVAARKSFETGLKLYGENAYTEALASFESSYRLGGRPTALRNIAQCQRNLKHFVEAYDAYELLLSAHGDKLAPADKKAVTQALDELSVLTATIAVAVNQAGADIELDGKSLGSAPLRGPKRTSVGTHRVRVTKAGFEAYDQNIALGSQENKKVEVALGVERRVGRVAVREPHGRDVHVFVDGEDKGPAPWEGELTAGEHGLEAKGPSFASDTRKITVAPKERVDVALEALPLRGHLRVTTIPAGATIAVDGKEMGTGAWEGDLPAGAHRLEATVSGHPAQARDVTIARGENVVQEITVLGAIGAKVVDYTGLYVGFSLEPYLAVGGQATNHADGVATSGNDRLVVGGGATIRGGYSFGLVSAEVVGAFLVDHRDEHQVVPQSISGSSTQITDATTTPNFFIGVGPRVTTRHELIRFTFALTPGLAIRSFELHRDLQVSSAGPGPAGQEFSAGYTAFALKLEGGVLLGSTPGTKVFLGVHAWLDFPPNDIVVGPDTISPLPNAAFRSPGRGIVLANSTQFFLGPVLGIRIGN